MSDEQAATEIRRELWCERPGDFYSDNLFVTDGGGIGINVGGTIVVKPLKGWFEAAARVRELEAELAMTHGLAQTYIQQRSAAEKQRDAIEAATIERCAKTAAGVCAPKSIGRDHARHHEAGAQAAARAIRALAKPPVHTSDCAVNNGPALPPGECNCGAEK